MEPLALSEWLTKVDWEGLPPPCGEEIGVGGCLARMSGINP